VKIRVYYEDTDSGGVVYHANYLKFCERARSEIFFLKGKSPDSGDCYFVVKSLCADFIKPAKLGDLLEVKNTLLELKNASLQMRQEIYKDKQMLFSMDLKLVHLCGGKIAKISNEMKEFFISELV